MVFVRHDYQFPAEQNGFVFSNEENQLPCSLATLQIAMRLRGVRQLVLVIDPQGNFFLGDPAKKIGGAPLEFLAIGDVIGKRRTGEIQGAFLDQ